MRRALFAAIVAGSMLGGVAQSQEPPGPGASPRIDAIRKAGELRVGMLANLP